MTGVGEVTQEWSLHPLTPERWHDFEALFGPRGACGGCWCMWWRLTRAEFDRMKGEGNREAMRALVESVRVPGILAYAGGMPVGWCSVAPREEFGALARSRVLRPVDDAPVWSVVCFFVDKAHRRRGLTVALLRAAVDYAAAHGATVVEGYPTDPKKADAPAAFLYTGTVSAFRKAGFVEVARGSPSRPIMRYVIGQVAL
ncbi:MAG: GNAT family N-acetyltransferase [Anaerolineales bacterium]